MIGQVIKMGFNATAVHRGFAKVATGFKGLAGKMKGVGRAMLAPFTKLMAVLAPLLTVGAFTRGMKDIVDYGGAVSDMATRLGLAADEVVVLQEVFRRTGIEQDRMADTLQLMGRNVYEALAYGTSTYARALEDLNLTGEDLKGLNLAEQFEVISGRIAALTDTNKQASVSSALFGRQGRALVNTFKSGKDVFETSRKSVGGLGGSMNRLSGQLDHISDAFGAIGGKFRQFFGGVAKEMMPVLTDLADIINNLDLTAAGQKFGGFVEQLVAAFQAGKLKDALWAQFQWAILRMKELLEAVALYFAQQLNDALSDTDLGRTVGLKKTGEGGVQLSRNPLAYAGFAPVLEGRAGGPGPKGFRDTLADVIEKAGEEGGGSLGASANASRIMQMISLQSRIASEREAGTEARYLKSMERHLARIVSEMGGGATFE